MTNTSKLISIKEAASILGVTPLTLRNWDRAGKLSASRHPMNNYRVYQRDEVEKLVESIASNKIERPTARPVKKGPKKLTVRHLED